MAERIRPRESIERIQLRGGTAFIEMRKGARVVGVSANGPGGRTAQSADGFVLALGDPTAPLIDHVLFAVQEGSMWPPIAYHGHCYYVGSYEAEAGGWRSLWHVLDGGEQA